MAKLDKETKERLIADLSHPYGAVKLVCDGREVDLQVRRRSGKSMRYCVMAFVDGKWEHRWSRDDKEHPEQKFARRSEKHVLSEKERKEFLKAAPAYGRKGSPKRNAFEARIEAKLVWFDPTFSTGSAAINHLLKVCESVSVAENLNPQD